MRVDAMEWWGLLRIDLSMVRVPGSVPLALKEESGS